MQTYSLDSSSWRYEHIYTHIHTNLSSRFQKLEAFVLNTSWAMSLQSWPANSNNNILSAISIAVKNLPLESGVTSKCDKRSCSVTRFSFPGFSSLFCYQFKLFCSHCFAKYCSGKIDGKINHLFEENIEMAESLEMCKGSSMLASNW